MKNYISHNIKYLCEKNFLKQNEFGELFDLGRSVVSMYVSEKSVPKIETLQKIGAYFKISIDDFINRPLHEVEQKNEIAAETPATYPVDSYKNKVESLQKWLDDKDKLIKSLERENAMLRGKDITAGKTG